MAEDDEYWNTSDVTVKVLSFEDDDGLSSQQFSRLRAGLGEGTGGEEGQGQAGGRGNLLPLHCLIEGQALNAVLLCGENVSPPSALPAPLLVSRCVSRRSSPLHHVRSLTDKTNLLDAAIAVGDGNTILAVTLFLSQTLKKKLFHRLLSGRPAAQQHYLHHLMQKYKTEQVTDVLTMLGRSGEATMRQYQLLMQSVVSLSPSSVLSVRLRGLASSLGATGAPTPPDTYKLLTDYALLLDWQKSCELVSCGEPALRSLARLTAANTASHGGTQAETLTKQLQISPQQFDWMLLTVHAAAQHWELLGSMFIKKNLLGRSSWRCCVSLSAAVSLLAACGAPQQLLASYLTHAPDIQTKLHEAKKHKVHSTVLECLVSQKDRQALTSYKMSLRPHSEEYFLAENALRTSGINWKN